LDGFCHHGPDASALGVSKFNSPRFQALVEAFAEFVIALNGAR
jgi:hypothetical protein